MGLIVQAKTVLSGGLLVLDLVEVGAGYLLNELALIVKVTLGLEPLHGGDVLSLLSWELELFPNSPVVSLLAIVLEKKFLLLVALGIRLLIHIVNILLRLKRWHVETRKHCEQLFEGFVVLADLRIDLVRHAPELALDLRELLEMRGRLLGADV